MTELVSCVEQIGEAAGAVWTLLSKKGPMPMSKLFKAVDTPRDLTLQAIGWLAREGKLCIVEKNRSRTISLKESE